MDLPGAGSYRTMGLQLGIKGILELGTFLQIQFFLMIFMNISFQIDIQNLFVLNIIL